MNRIEKNIRIKYSINDKIFHYSGIVISEDSDFIDIKETKEGLISLNKRNIIQIEQNGDEKYDKNC